MADNNQGSRAIKAGVGYTIGNIFCKGLSFLSTFIFARLLSTADFGIYNTFSSYVSILAVMIGFALHVSIKNAYLDYGDKLDGYCSSISLLTVGNSLLLFALAWIFRRKLGEVLSIPTAMVAIVVVESFSTAMMQFYNDYLAVHFLSKKYLLISLTYAVAGTVLSVILVCLVFPNERYLGRALGTMIPLLCIAVFILFTIYRKARPKVNREYWKYGLKISLPIVPHGLSQLILAQFDRIMIKKSVGDVEAGLYSFANSIGFIFQVITNSMDTAFCPWFFGRMQEKNYDSIRRTTNVYVVFVSLMAMGLLLICPELILIMGGAKYMESRYVVMPIVLSVYFAFLYTLPSSVEYYHKKTKIIAAGTMAAAALNVILNSTFIPLYGYVAAAYTTVFCYVCYFLIHLFICWRVQKGMLFDLRVLLGCAAAVTVFMFVCLWLVDAILIRMVILVIFLAFLGLLGWKNREYLMLVLKSLRS